MLQVEPCFVNAAVPLGWKQVGGPLPLENACCLHGVPLTYLQIKKLIKAFGGSIKGTPPKRTLQLQLIDMLLPPEQHEEAKALIENEKVVKDDGFDSDFSELISELGQDEGNTQDLKEYKDKKKVRKLKRKMAAAGAEEVPKPKKKAKAKAKAKGKGKGKAGGKGGKGKKAKKGLWASLLKRAQALRQEEIEKEVGGEDAGMRKEEVEKKADMGMGEASETGGGAQVEAEGATSSGSKEKKVAAEVDSKDASMEEVEAGGATSSGSKEKKVAAGEGSKDASMEEVEAEGATSSGSKEKKVAAGEGSKDASMEEVEAEGATPSVSKEKAPAKRRLHGDDDDAAEPRRTKKYKSPQEILDMLQPPGCKLTLGYIDHRFSSKFEADDPRLSGKLKQKTFSKSFAERRGWQEALKEVHTHNWEKWDKIKDKFPLPAGVEPQVPGDISEEVLDLLKPVIADMPSLAKPKWVGWSELLWGFMHDWLCPTLSCSD